MVRSLIVLSLLLSLAVLDAPAQEKKKAGGRNTQQRQTGPWQASGKNGAISAGGLEAVNAGLTVMKSGGNAMDGAAATILALTVTDSNSVCFGGEVPILVYDAKRNVVEVLCGLGAAPRLATRAHFSGPDGIPGRGKEPAPVPGLLDACVTILERYGTKSFAEAAAPTLALLDKGGRDWHPDLARTLRRLCEAERAAGSDRRRGLRLVSDCFYRGPIAREIDEWSRANGALLRYSDLATHVTRIEEPVTADYRGHTVYKCGVWTQGPFLLQTLRLLEGFDVKGLGHNKPDTVHITTEALKLAFADRDFYYADPHFVSVPIRELLSDGYTGMRRPLIDRDKASLEQRPGDPLGKKPLLEKAAIRAGIGGPAQDTTTCVVADGAGNVVAATPSGFSGVVAGKTGVWLSTRLQSFNAWEGHVNCIEPGKRPRITLTPTLVFKDGKPVFAMSVAGGDAQDQTMVQLIMNSIDFGMAPAQAVTAPRFGTNHHLGSFRQKLPELGSLLLAPSFDDATIQDLSSRGHKVTNKGAPSAAPSMLRINREQGTIEAAGESRARRHAGAY